MSKLHHTIPQFYLRGFTNDKKLITTVQLSGPKTYTTPTKGTGATNQFYAIKDHPDGADVFEKGLSEIEADAAAVFRKIDAGHWPLAPEDRAILGAFIALQAVRGPDHRRNIGHMMSETVRLLARATPESGVVGWARDHVDLEVTEEEAFEWWNEAKDRSEPFDVPATVHIAQMADLMFEILPMLIGRPWALVPFKRRHLLTSDVPVNRVKDPAEPPWSGAGFLTAKAITFPVSRSVGLVMAEMMPVIEMGVPVETVQEGKLDTVVDGTTAHEKMFNHGSIRSASEYLYLHPDDVDLLPDPLPEPRPTSVVVGGGGPTLADLKERSATTDD